jgi:hypothetical protein
MSRSRVELARAGMMMDGGPPFCRECGARLHFGSDRSGRTTESCDCGYRGLVATQRGPSPDDPMAKRQVR